jgi:membrane protease subunit HflK
MTFNLPALKGAGLARRIRGMFNLNDPRWGRGGESGTDGDKPEEARPGKEPPLPPSSNGRGQGGPNQGPPDLDELWRDFNRKLGNLFGGSRGGGRRDGGGSTGGFQPPDMKSAGVGAGLIAAVAVLIWLGTGFFIVQEGQQGRHHAVRQI